MNVAHLGLIFLGFIGGFFVFGLPVITSGSNTSVERDESKFKIVDKYKNCDVVQYDQHFATYKYFLHCSTPQ